MGDGKRSVEKLVLKAQRNAMQQEMTCSPPATMLRSPPLTPHIALSVGGRLSRGLMLGGLPAMLRGRFERC